MDNRPGPGNDVRLVGVEERQRKAGGGPGDPERGGQREDGAERRKLGGRERPTRERQRRALDVGHAVADERFHVARDEHGVDPGALELLDIFP